MSTPELQQTIPGIIITSPHLLGELLVNYVASKWYKSPDLLQIQNTFDDAVQLRIRRNNSSPNFPISMRFVTFDSSDEANAIGDKVDLGTLQTDIELVINPKGTKWVLIILLTPSPNRFVARTSFFNVSTILSIDIKENLSAMETRKDINISATLITSVMHIEHTRIDFDDCKIGAHYVQHLQIWNRSESTLLFRLVPTTLEAVNLQFEDVDGPILTGSVLRLSPFGSIQLRVIFRAENLGTRTVDYLCENIHNTENSVTLSCRLSVVSEDETAITVTVGSGKALALGDPFNLGDCYCGIEKEERFELKNNTSRSLTVALTSDCAEIDFNVSGGVLSILPTEATPLVHLQRWKDRETHQSTSESPSAIDPKVEASRSLEKVSPIRKEVEFGKQDPRAGTPGGSADAVRAEGDDDEEYVCSPSVARGVGSAKPSFPTEGTKENAPPPWEGFGANVGKYMQQILGNQGRLWGPNDNAASWLNWGDDQEVDGDIRMFTSAGANKVTGAVDDILTVRLREGGTDASSPDDATSVLTVASKDNDTWSREATSFSSSKQLSKAVSTFIIPPAASAVVTIKFCPRPDPHGAPGRSFERSMDLLLKWTLGDSEMLDARRSPLGRHDSTVVERHISCRAQVCESIVSVESSVVDLGECAIGEYKTAVFAVRNESDFPAVITPFVESDTLAVVDKEIHIPPREVRPVKFEHVASREKIDYRREAFILNKFNTACRIDVQVRAKNVDNGQVLLHSALYELKTFNKFRQLQLYFDKCLVDMPNMRVFSVRNVSDHVLELNYQCSGFDGSGVGEGEQVSADVWIFEMGELETSMNKRNKGVADSSQSLKASIVNVKASEEEKALHTEVKDAVATPIRTMPRSQSFSFTDSNNDGTSLEERLGAPQRGADDDDQRRRFSAAVSTLSQHGFPFNMFSRIKDGGSSARSTLDDSNVEKSGKSATADEAITVDEVKQLQQVFAEADSQWDTTRNILGFPYLGIKPVPLTFSPGEVRHFGVFFRPRSASIKDAHEPTLTRQIAIHVGTCSDQRDDGSLSPRRVGPADIIMPRILLLRAKVARSTLSVLQKNINFSRTTIGQTQVGKITLSNKSTTPCIYSFKTRRNFCSDNLVVVGRKGLIASGSSRHVDIIFKPTLPGNFEETLIVENVLQPGAENAQTIVIKAKVFKSDNFELFEVNEAGQETIVATAGSLDVSPSLSKETENTTASFGLPMKVLGTTNIGEECPTISLKLRNVSQKSRQFKIVLLQAHPSPLELRTICRFKEEKVKTKNVLSPEAKIILQDNLEKFRQKLKIAIRKNKAEKIAKYEAKIKVVEAALSGTGNPIDVGLEEEEDDDEGAKKPKDKSKQKGDKEGQKLKGDVSGESLNRKDVAAPVEGGKLGGAADGGKPDGGATDGGKPDGGAADGGKPDGGATDGGKPDGGATDGGKSDGGEGRKPDGGATDGGKPDGGATDGGKSDGGATDGGKPDGGATDGGKPDGPTIACEKSISSFVGSSHAFDSNLGTVATTVQKVGDRAEVVSQGEISPSMGNATAGFRVLDRSETELHFELDKEEVIIINCTVTALPGPGGRDWESTVDLFGHFRVSESRNDDQYKAVSFQVACVSTIESKKLSTALDRGRGEVGRIRTVNFLNSLPMPEHVAIEVSAANSCPTKHLFSHAHVTRNDILDTSIKLTLLDDGKMHGIFWVCSSRTQLDDVKISIVDVAIQREGLGTVSPYSFINHGTLEIGVRCVRGVETHGFNVGNESHSFPTVFGDPVAVTIAWNSASQVSRPSPLGEVVAFVQICALEFVGVVPVVVHQTKSSFMSDKHLNVKDIPLGSVLTRSLAITNTSVLDVQYAITLREVSTDICAVSIPPNEQTGSLGPQSSKSVSIRLEATNIGPLEMELWVTNTQDQFDANRTLISANVVSPLVAFPDLQRDQITGLLKLDLGKIQLSDKIEAYQYVLRVTKISTKMLLMTAVSNLKRIKIFSDESCSKEASSLLLSDGVTLLFVSIKQSSQSGGSKEGIAQAQAQDTATPLDASLMQGRELVGGIRLDFFETNNPHDQWEEASTRQNPEIQAPTQVRGRKIFDAAIAVTATVGMSKLRVTSQPAVFSRVDTARATSFGGSLVLENLSPTFDLEYEFIDQTNTCPPTLTLSNERSKFVVSDSDDVKIPPKGKKVVQYDLSFLPFTNGLTVHVISIRNKSTQEVTSLSLVWLLTSGQLVLAAGPMVTVPSVENDSSEISLLPPSKIPIWLKRVSGRSTESLGATRIAESFEVMGPARKTMLTCVLKNSSDKSLTISPMSDLPIVVYIEEIDKEDPSKLPTVAKFDSKKQSESTSTKRRADSYQSLLSFSSNAWRGLKRCGGTAVAKAGSEMLVRIVPAVGSVCGNSFINFSGGNSSSINEIVVHNGGVCLNGVLGFVSSMEVLESFFGSSRGPPSTNSKKTEGSLASLFDAPKPESPSDADRDSSTKSHVNLDSGAGVNELTFFPILCVSGIKIPAIVPKLSFSSVSNDFGVLRKGKMKMITFAIVQNTCEGDLPMSVENIPDWIVSLQLCISDLQPNRREVVSAEGSREPSEGNSSVLADVLRADERQQLAREETFSCLNTLDFIVPALSKIELRATARGPGGGGGGDGDAALGLKLYECTMLLRNLANSSETSRPKTDVFDVNLRLEVETLPLLAIEALPSQKSSTIWHCVNQLSDNVAPDNTKSAGRRYFVCCPESVENDNRHIVEHLTPIDVPSTLDHIRLSGLGHIEGRTSGSDILKNQAQCPQRGNPLNLSMKNVRGQKAVVTGQIQISGPLETFLEASNVDLSMDKGNAINVPSATWQMELGPSEAANVAITLHAKTLLRVQARGTFALAPLAETNAPPTTVLREEDLDSLMCTLPTSTSSSSSSGVASLTLDSSRSLSLSDASGHPEKGLAMDADELQNTKSDFGNADFPRGVIGPMLLATISLKVASHNSARSSKATSDESDDICIDVVGYLALGPTAFVASCVPHVRGEAGTQRTHGPDLHIQLPVSSDPDPSSSLTTWPNSLNQEHSLVFTASPIPDSASHMSLIDGDKWMCVANPSAHEFHPRVVSPARRSPGMRLHLQDVDVSSNLFGAAADNLDLPATNELSYVDTVRASLAFVDKEIKVGFCKVVAVSLVHGCVSETVRETMNASAPDANANVNANATDAIFDFKSKDSALPGAIKPLAEARDDCTGFDVMRIPVLIHDDAWPLHPPAKLWITLRSTVPVIPIKALPVSHTNRHKQHMDLSLHEDGGISGRKVAHIDSAIKAPADPPESFSNDTHSSEQSLPSSTARSDRSQIPSVRIRGATPCDKNLSVGSGHDFEVNLGLLVCQDEFVEWIITLENCSSSAAVKYFVRLSEPNDDRAWLLLSHSMSHIEPSGSSSLALYLSRRSPGVFKGDIIVSTSESLHLQRLQVRMEVVERSSRGQSVQIRNVDKLSTSDTIDPCCL